MLEEKKMQAQKLTEEELHQVNGGNRGDSNRERSKTPGGIRPLYKVGDQVEVYTNFFHIATYTAVILNIDVVYENSWFYPKYSVRNIETGAYDNVYGDTIQSD